MPTAKPRITIMLEPRSYEVIKRLSAAGGESMSSIVAEFVNVALPSLERVVLVLERARAAPKEVSAGLRAAVERAERDMLPAMSDALGHYDLFMEEAEAATRPKRTRPARARSGGSSTPVPVTRGSGTAKTLSPGPKRQVRKGVSHG